LSGRECCTDDKETRRTYAIYNRKKGKVMCFYSHTFWWSSEKSTVQQKRKNKVPVCENKVGCLHGCRVLLWKLHRGVKFYFLYCWKGMTVETKENNSCLVKAFNAKRKGNNKFPILLKRQTIFPNLKEHLREWRK